MLYYILSHYFFPIDYCLSLMCISFFSGDELLVILCLVDWVPTHCCGPSVRASLAGPPTLYLVLHCFDICELVHGKLWSGCLGLEKSQKTIVAGKQGIGV